MLHTDPVNILIVDDLPDKLLALETILESLGENLVTARSGREALRKLLDRDFAVILLDVNMPDMDGFETAALIRQHKRCARTPIIFITAFADEMLAAHGYALGAVDYILSPVLPDVLRTKVAVFVDLFRKTEQAKEHAQQQVELAREQAAREVAEEANRRSAFLATASAVLASSLDEIAIRGGLLRLAVPFLADLSFLTLVDELSHEPQTDMFWSEPPLPAQEVCIRGQCLLPQNLGAALERVLQSGRSEVLPEIDPWPEALSQGRPSFELTTAVLLPLRARDRTLGALGLARGAPGRYYLAADLELAKDLAGRTAIAIDHARLYRDVQEADRRKAEFLAVLSHELRNPLAPIRNALQILGLVESDDPTLCEARDILDRQVGQLTGLVNDLLNVFRVTHHKIVLQKEGIDLADLVRGVVEDHRHTLESEGRNLYVDLPDQSIWVSADRTRLIQVLINLLQNAIKFTNTGDDITVRATTDCNRNCAVIAVHDTGIGISPEVLPHIFDTFAQADQGMDRSRGGLGLGLALVKGLVEMHGGKVHAASDGPGCGAEVGFWIPLASKPPTLKSSPSDAAFVTRSLRLLIVEDNRDSARSLATLLRRCGHEVEVAHTGTSGMETAREWKPDVVLCDLGLPEMDGYEVARALRGDPATAPIRLIAVSGYGQEDDQDRSRAAGFELHLTKPVDLLKLQRHLAASACSESQLTAVSPVGLAWPR